jgi:uncharacterized protein with FMN-binding domain
MKKRIALLLVAMMLMTASAMAMTPGTYTGVAKGMFDGLTVEVTVTENAITDVKVTDYQETAPGWPALEKLPADIVAAQTVEVDDVSGATMSSKGVKAAVRAALTAAGAAETDFAAAAETAITLAPDYFPVMGSFEVPETWDESYDVVVVGQASQAWPQPIPRRPTPKTASSSSRNSPPPAATPPSTAASMRPTPPKRPSASRRNSTSFPTPPRSTSRTP